MSAHDVMEALYSHWTTKTLDTTVTGGLWLSLAPQGTAYPYCVYDVISNVPISKHGSSSTAGTEVYDLEFQLSLYDDKMSTLAAASKAVRTAFDFASITLGASEGDVLQVRFANEIPTKLEDDIWQWVLVYNIMRSLPIDPSGGS